jgi:4-hydroxybutyrate CoA-transferase
MPKALAVELANRAHDLEDVEALHILTLGDAPWAAPSLSGHLRANALFVGANVRAAVHEGRADATPMFLSEIPQLLRVEKPVDVALVQVSPPDARGLVTLGVSVDIVRAAVDGARAVIAQVNPRMPRTFGAGILPFSLFTDHIDADEALAEWCPPILKPVDMAIGRNVASLVRDGDTLQLGIGTVPNAVLAELRNHRDLGVHTEMFSDGVVELVERGVITGARKSYHRGRIVTSFVIGTKRVYDFVDNNPLVEFHESDWTNSPSVIARHDAMVSINSAISVDLTGQVCADSIGGRIYSGVGGQVDFVRGARASRGGRSILALPSTAKGGSCSRIVAELAPGSSVTTSRNDVHFIATEHGIVNLHGLSLRERAARLIGLASPAFRDDLAREARAKGLIGAFDKV